MFEPEYGTHLWRVHNTGVVLFLSQSEQKPKLLESLWDSVLIVWSSLKKNHWSFFAFKVKPFRSNSFDVTLVIWFLYTVELGENTQGL